MPILRSPGLGFIGNLTSGIKKPSLKFKCQDGLIGNNSSVCEERMVLLSLLSLY